MMGRHAREQRIVTRIVGDFEGFCPGNLFVFEHDPDLVWVQVSGTVEDGVFRLDPACILEWDLGRCCATVEQLVLSVECCGSAVVVERVKGRPLPREGRVRSMDDDWPGGPD